MFPSSSPSMLVLCFSLFSGPPNKLSSITDLPGGRNRFIMGKAGISISFLLFICSAEPFHSWTLSPFTDLYGWPGLDLWLNGKAELRVITVTPCPGSTSHEHTSSSKCLKKEKQPAQAHISYICALYFEMWIDRGVGDLSWMSKVRQAACGGFSADPIDVPLPSAG